MKTRFSIDIASGVVVQSVGGDVVSAPALIGGTSGLITVNDVLNCEVVFTAAGVDQTALVLQSGYLMKLGLRSLTSEGAILAQSNTYTMVGAVANCTLSLSTAEIVNYINTYAPSARYGKVYFEVEVSSPDGTTTVPPTYRQTFGQTLFALQFEVNENADEPPATAAQSAATATAQATIATTEAGIATTQAGIATTQATNAAASASTALAAAGVAWKGTVAGASVPATSTAAGDKYIISSAGTSQGITWAAGDIALYLGTSGSWAQVSAVTVLGISAPVRNSLAPRGGAAFDGTALNSLSSPDSPALAYGTDNFSHVIVMRRLTYTPAAEVSLVEKASSNLGWRLRLTTGGYLKLQIGNGTDYITNSYTSTSPVATPAFKTAHLAFAATRTGSVVFFENGVQIGSSVSMAASSAQTATSIGTLRCGYDGTVSDVCIIYNSSGYNFALAQSDITEIYELGGAVPERLKFGSQFSFFSPSAGIASGSTGVNFNPTSGGSPLGKSYTVKLVVTGFSGSSPDLCYFWIGNPNSWVSAGLPSGFTVDGTYFLNYTGVGVFNGYRIGCSNPNTFSGTVTATFYARGCVCSLACDDGLGWQLQDASSNRLHALMTTTGATHSLPRCGPARLRGQAAAASGNQQLLGGQNLLPGNAQVLRFRARALTGTPTVYFGNVSGGAQFVASVALSTAWKDLTVALTGGVNASDAPLWLNSTTTDIVQFDITWEPISV